MNFSISNFDPQITISTAEMLEISQKISRDFAPVLPAQIDNTTNPEALSSQQLLDISEHISIDFAPKVIHNSPQLMLLPVDPNNIYAYWNLDERDAHHIEKNDPVHQEHTLRIYSIPATASNSDRYNIPSWSDFIIDDTKHRQNITLPLSVQKKYYYAALGKLEEDNNLTPLANSNTTVFHFGKTASFYNLEDSALLLPHNCATKDYQDSIPIMNKSSSGQRI
jgi:Domain of unknown function (DUF4912)